MLRYLPRPMSISAARGVARRYEGGRRQRGYSLLELLLALSLTVIVLALANMAVEFHLRSLDKRRTQLEESQLARSILRLIADDLRGAVQHFEQDTSEIEALLQQSVASAAGSLGAAAAGAAGGADAGGASAGGSSGSSPGGGQSNANPGDSSSSNTSQSGSSGSRGGSSGGGSTSSGSSQPGASSFSTNSTGSTGSSSTSADQPSQNTEDLSTTTIPPVPGLFGNQYQLQVDVSRLPRIEDYQQYLTPDAATSVVDVPSDVKTVTYFVQSTSAISGAAGMAASQSLADLSDPNANGTGLVRRELDRSVTLWAMNNGNYTGLQNSGEVIAPEVAGIEFQYFDGTQWLTEWDSESQQKLPIAVLVILALRAPGADPALDAVPSTLTAETAGNLHLYRLLVYLPSGGQSPPEQSSTASSSSTSDSAASTSTDGATAGGSP